MMELEILLNRGYFPEFLDSSYAENHFWWQMNIVKDLRIVEGTEVYKQLVREG